jgi:hypothetical protein
MAALEIDDAEPPLAEMRPAIMVETKIVGAAMANCLGHALQDPSAAARGRYSYESGNPTHDKECGIARFALR